MILNAHFPVFGQSGTEEVCRQLLISLDRLGVDIRLIPKNEWNQTKVTIQDDDMYRLLRMANKSVVYSAPLLAHQKWQSFHDNFKEKYIVTLFETDRLPISWINGLKKFNKIFTFSEFNKNCWKKNNNIESININFGIDKERFNTNTKKMQILNAKKFKFITSGDYTERKNFDTLLSAYCQEFKSYEDVCLIMKTHYGGFSKKHKDALFLYIEENLKKYKNKPKILIFDNIVSTNNIPIFYNGANCFVLPSRGEGIGLPVAEAMSCGCPVLVSNWSALSDFCNKNNSILIKGKVKTIESVEYIKKCPDALNHKWFECDKEDLKKKMRWAFENREELKKLSKNAQETMQRYEWHYSAIKLLKTIFGGLK